MEETNMKSMKRFTIMAAAMALAVASMTSCANGGSSSSSNIDTTEPVETTTESSVEPTTGEVKSLDPEKLAEGDKALDEYFNNRSIGKGKLNVNTIAGSYDGAAMIQEEAVADSANSILPGGCYVPSSGTPRVTGERILEENGFIKVSDNAISTFGADVDTASFSLLRDAARYGNYIDANQIRTEEIINYFKYDYNEPTGDDIFGLNAQVCDCPWNAENKLMSIGLQAKKADIENREPMNIVFLIDTSGSMSWCIENLKSGLISLKDQISEKDTVSIVTYAGDWSIPLEGVSGNDFDKIEDTIRSLMSGGVTNGSGGINAAYEIAQKYFIDGGNNRVVLLTDGDFNMGITSADELRDLISKNRDTGIFLSVMGFGASANGDLIMETLADRGNGNYNNITDEADARKALVEDFAGNLFTVAKDTKLKVTFNADTVAEYRLIGYENRALTEEEYNNDAVDSGDVGLGHQVTALYEIVPASGSDYNTEANIAELEVKYKKPTADRSDAAKTYEINTSLYNSEATGNIALAAAATEYVMTVTSSEFMGTASMSDALQLIEKSGLHDEYIDTLIQMIDAYDETGITPEPPVIID
jgi:Ca-activated chloride channel family protein